MSNGSWIPQFLDSLYRLGCGQCRAGFNPWRIDQVILTRILKRGAPVSVGLVQQRRQSIHVFLVDIRQRKVRRRDAAGIAAVLEAHGAPIGSAQAGATHPTSTQRPDKETG